MATHDQATAPAAIAALRTRIDQSWRNFSPRERSLVRFAAAVIALLLLWLIAVRPAMQTLRQAPGQLAVLDAQLQHMQRMAAESLSMRDTAPVAPTAATASLRAATERLGPGASLQLQGERATLTFNDVPAPQLIAWLAEARSGARARPADAQFTRSGPGYSGSVVLLLGPGS